jgi:hypothetical protein
MRSGRGDLVFLGQRDAWPLFNMAMNMLPRRLKADVTVHGGAMKRVATMAAPKMRLADAAAAEGRGMLLMAYLLEVRVGCCV